MSNLQKYVHCDKIRITFCIIQKEFGKFLEDKPPSRLTRRKNMGCLIFVMEVIVAIIFIPIILAMGELAPLGAIIYLLVALFVGVIANSLV